MLIHLSNVHLIVYFLSASSLDDLYLVYLLPLEILECFTNLYTSLLEYLFFLIPPPCLAASSLLACMYGEVAKASITLRQWCSEFWLT